MREPVKDTNLIAYCGLYCGSCRSYLKERCPGCRESKKLGWCKIRTCCMEQSYKSCADCTTYIKLPECKKLNNLIAKFFALVFKSNRFGSLELIRAKGYDEYAREMTEKKTMTVEK